MLAMLAWQGMDTIKNDARHFSKNSEYILVYAKNLDDVNVRGIKKTEKQRKNTRTVIMILEETICLRLYTLKAVVIVQFILMFLVTVKSGAHLTGVIQDFQRKR